MKQELSIFEKEFEFLIRETLDNRSESVGELSTLLDKYRAEDVYSILNLYFPQNAEKYSELELREGIDKVGRYLEVLDLEYEKLDKVKLSFFNQMTYEQSLLRNLEAELSEKASALQLYQSDYEKNIFFNSQIGDWSNKRDALDILTISDNANGIVLPIRQATRVRASGLSIFQGNGQVGDSYNMDALGGTENPLAILDSNPTTIFEYTSLNVSELEVGLEFKLDTPQVLNGINIGSVEYGFMSPLLIKELSYATESGKWVPWTVGNAKPANRFHYLDPIETRTLRIVLVTSGSELVFVSRERQANRSILGLTDIDLYQVQYEEKGELISTSRVIGSHDLISLQSIASNVEVPELSEIEILGRSNAESSWQEMSYLNDSDRDFIKAEGQSFELKLKMKVKTSEFETRSSFIKEGSPKFNYRTFFARSENPNRFNIPNTGKVETLQANMETGVGIGLGRFSLETYQSLNTTGVVSYFLPQPIPTEGVRVYLNGHLIEESATPSSSTYTTGYLDKSPVIQLDDSEAGQDLKVEFLPEVLTLSPDGTEFKGELRNSLFYEDSTLILEALDGVSSDQIVTMNPGKDFFELGFEIVSDIQLRVRNTHLVDAGYVSVIGTQENPRLNMTPGNKEYWVNSQLGIIYFSEASTERLFVSFKSKDIKRISDFSIRTEGSKSSIQVKPSSLLSIPIEERLEAGSTRSAAATFSSTSTPEFYPDTLLHMSTDQKTLFLSHGHVLKGSLILDEVFIGSASKEVPYLDGYKELNEGTYKTSTFATSSLSAGTIKGWQFTNPSLINASLGLVVSHPDFLNEVASYAALLVAGDWFFDSITGELWLETLVNTGIPVVAGYWIESVPNEAVPYSVNYEEGLVFFKDSITAKGIVSYEVASYRVRYKIGKNLTHTIGSSNEILIEASQMEPGKKVSFLFEETQSKTNLERFANYYSPVIDFISVGIA